MTCGEDEAEDVVVDHMVQGVLECVGQLLLLELQLAGNLFMLLQKHAAASQGIDRASLRRRHQPCAGIVRETFLRPNFEGSHERILRELLGNTDIVSDASNRGDEAGGFDLPHGLNRLSYIAHAT